MNIIKYISKFLNRIKLIGKLRHLYHIRKAKKIIKTLKLIALTPYYEGKIINYLRKINPYVFEELILTVIEESNIRVFRNIAYSGDGGIDGIFKIKQGKVLVQCKRYGKYINAKDVKDLSVKVASDKYFMGIFVHTGKTGEKSKNIGLNEKNVIFLSGSNLVNVIVGKEDIKKYLFTKISYYEKQMQYQKNIK